MRALFLAPWPREAASTRLRAEQYFPYLRTQGIQPIFRPFMSPALYRFVYADGLLAEKFGHVLLASLRRVTDLVAAARADVVFVHREAFPFWTTAFERAIARLGVPMVLDFDDAIYLPTPSHVSNLVGKLRNPSKVNTLMGLSQAVTVGNRHLQRYAAHYNPQSVVIPTPVDTDVYRPCRDRSAADRPVVIGWIGSGTTAPYLNQLSEPLARLADRHPNLRFSIVGGRAPAVERLPGARFSLWSLQDELPLLHGMDVGLMPYPDTEWALGKCAFKALLYMSVGVPAVCSAIGMAEEVVQDGVNGRLARTEEDWFQVLDELVSNAERRRQLGDAGRQSVEAAFSLREWAPRLADILHTVAAGRPICQPDLAPAPLA